MDPRLRHIYWFIAELFAAVLLALALFLIIIRVALPQADQFKPQVELWASQAFGETVRIGAVQAHWPGIDLTIVLDQVDLLDDQGSPRVEFDRAFVNIDLFASLFRRQLVFNELHLDGLELSLLEDRKGPPGAPRPAFDVGEGAEPRADVNWFLPWLLSQPQVDVTSGLIHWRGLESESRQFKRFSLRTRNRGDHHSLSLHVDAGIYPGVINLEADFDGEATRPDSWQGQVYLRGRQVRWRLLLELAEAAFPGRDLTLGSHDEVIGLPQFADFNAWAVGADGAVQRIAGEVAIADALTSQPEGLKQVATRFDWTPQESGWEVALDGIDVEPVGSSRYRTGPARIRYLQDDTEAITVEAALASVDISLLHRLAEASGKLDPDMVSMLDGMTPAGQFYNLRGRWQPGKESGEPRWRLAGEAWDIALDPWKKLPGLAGLRLQFDVGPEGGTGELYGRNAVVTLPQLFREPLDVARLSGGVEVRHTDGGWLLSADSIDAVNTHITTRTRLQALLPAEGGSPFLDLEVGYRDGNASEAWRYLPVGIMGDEVVSWLDHALVDGRVVEGGMLLHGSLDRFPYDEHDGRFQVRFLVEEMTLDYLDGWPPIEDLQAWTVFDGRGMRIDADHGRIFSATIGRTSAYAANLTANEPRLLIDGVVGGDVGDGLRYLRESPLREGFGDYLAVAQGAGRLDLGLDLDISLKGGATAVKGTIDLADAKLDLPAFGIALERSQGRLEFGNETLVGQGLSSEWLGMPVTIDVRVPDDMEAGRRGPRITAHGRLGEPQLEQLLPSALRARFAGSMPWEAAISVREQDDGHIDRVTIEVDSDLEGLEVTLPSPLGKPTAMPRRLAVEATLPADGATLLRADYGPLSLVSELRNEEGVLTSPRAGLALGSGPAALPETATWRADLRAESLDLDAWQAFAEELDDGTSPAISTPPLEVHVRIGELPVGEILALHDVDATVAGDSDVWRVALESREAAGQIEVPRTPGRDRPLVVQLGRLAIDYDNDSPGEEAPEDDESTPATSTTDPRELPGLRVGIDALVVNGIDLGAFSVLAEPVPEGLQFTRIGLDSGDWTLDGSGDWRHDGVDATTAFDLQLDTTAFDRLSTALFGERSDMVVDETHYQAQLNWPGAPTDLALATLGGTLEARLVDGVLTEVQPGVGRVFSLVNMRTLGRRLSLDFSDLVEQGTHFDSISGRFLFERGDAFTNDLLIETSAATVNLMGRTGLVARDYDQVMTVLPHISGTLPIAGTVLGGPVVGAALLVFSEAFSEDVNKLSQVQYRISGPWDAPVVERIERGPTPTLGQDSSLPQSD